MNVWLKGSTIGTVSGPDGRFKLQLKEKEGLVNFSFYEYKIFDLSFKIKNEDLLKDFTKQ